MTTLTLSHDSTNMGYDITLINFPELTGNGWTENTADDAPYRFEPDPIWTATEKLFQDALTWAALAAAQHIHHTSDSHVDDQYALARFIAQMTDIVYGYDQTLDLPAAIQAWLNDQDAIDDLIYVCQLLNFAPTHGRDTPLFAHFLITDTDEDEA